MAPELGIFSLILAFVLSLSQAFFGLTGAWRGKAVWMAVARPAVTGQFVFVVMAFACLVYSFVNNDFSVLYVARNSNSHLPLFYQVAALWGAHEGSLLLWILILSIWSVAVAAFSRHLPLSFSSRVLGVMGLISGGFMLFTLWTSNPFQRLIPAGPGLFSRGCFKPLALRSEVGGPITSWVGADGGFGIRSRTPRSCLGWWELH
jgi:cytochrome c-type biogenesis protein CcmF